MFLPLEAVVRLSLVVRMLIPQVIMELGNYTPTSRAQVPPWSAPDAAEPGISSLLPSPVGPLGSTKRPDLPWFRAGAMGPRSGSEVLSEERGLG